MLPKRRALFVIGFNLGHFTEAVLLWGIVAEDVFDRDLKNQGVLGDHILSIRKRKLFGSGPGTEEFPFTNRQYVIPEDPLILKVTIKDVLGDDPPQENSLGKMTQVETYDE